MARSQETFLRAWRKRRGFKGRSAFRAWLHRIATNARLDALARQPRRVSPESEVPWSMPPEPGVWVGRDVIVSAWVEGGLGTEEYRDFRLIATRANRQPALANYLRRPGDSEYRALVLDVLRIEDGSINEIMAFGPATFTPLGPPPTLSA